MTTYVEFETADGTILVEVAEVKDKRTTPTGGVVKASRDDVDKKVQEVIEKAHYTFESGLDVVRRNADAFVKKMNELAASPAGRAAGLRAFFAWVVQSKQMASNPAAEVKGVRQAKRVPQALSAQEVYQLQRTAAGQRQLAEAQAGKDTVTPAVMYARRDEALLNLLLYTGLRVGEVAALKTTDVVLNERSGKVIVRSGKGRKYREVLAQGSPASFVSLPESAASGAGRPSLPGPARATGRAGHPDASGSTGGNGQGKGDAARPAPHLCHPAAAGG